LNPSNKKALSSLLKNPSALFGLVVITLATIIAIMAYGIMPDGSTNANNGMLAVRKKPIGYTCQVLHVQKNYVTEEQSFISKLINGDTPSYRSLAVEAVSFDSLGFLHYCVPGSEQTKCEKIAMADIAYPIQAGSRWQATGDSIHFTDIHNNSISIPYITLKSTILEKLLSTENFRLGTDGAGRDLLSRLILGSRISLAIGFVAVLISISIGTFLGALAGYYRGVTDQVIMWFTTIFWSIPGIMLVIAISMALQSKGIWVTFLAVGLTTWVETARVVRGQVMEMREKQFIEAAQALGYSDFRIIFKHILPNIMAPLIVIATSNFASAILIEAGLSFLGLGVQPPTPSWGMMVHEGYTLLTNSNSWHLIVFPSISISILVLAFNLFGNALRDAFDPKNK